MDTWPLALARTLHFIATAQVAGLWLTAGWVAGPALCHPQAELYRRRVRRLGWASLFVAVASGLAWLSLEAVAMSAQPLSLSLLATLLTETQFGRDFAIRAGIAVLLAALLAVGRPTVMTRTVLVLLGLALMGSLAWAGHAAASEGARRSVHLIADTVHLLAAAAWLGGLPPLALILVAAGKIGGADGARMAATAARRFAVVGIISVALLLSTGLINAWFLVGTLAGLAGTDYGRLLLLKLILFAALLGLAAVNRQILTPRLASGTGGAAARLARNALVEAGLGAALLAVVGILGTLPPALHARTWWPFPYRLDWSGVAGRIGVDAQMIEAGMVAAAIIVLLLAPAAFLRHRTALLFGAGLTAAAVVAAVTVRPLLIAATPTSFVMPEIPYSATEIAQGSRLYQEHCLSCHREGPPLGNDGDLFWWSGHRRAASAAPLSDHQRWDVVWYLRARAAADMAAKLGPQVAEELAPRAPDFDFETADDQQGSLLETAAERTVLLVFFDTADPASRARSRQLVQRRAILDDMGVRILAVATGDASSADMRDIAVTTDPDVPQVFGAFVAGQSPHVEYLIDRAGRVRARWRPDDALDWRSGKVLARQVEQLRLVAREGGPHQGHR